MASGSQNMTTYNARTVIGSNSAASPAGALLLSGAGRADNATGDTWIFLDSAGGTSTPWGIKHDQANNKIHIYGNNTDSVWTRMNTGDTYILGKVGIGYDPETSGNTYKLYVNGSSFFNDHIYLVADKEFYMQYDNTMYDVLHNHNNGNISVNAASAGLYMAYYNTTFVNWMNGRMELRDGCLSLFPNNNAYRDGMRIHMFNSWSTITLCGADNTGNSGTSANSWFIGNNDGNFYIARNGSPGSTAYIGCVSNVWKFVTAADIPEGAANLSAAASVHTLSIYRNGITIPYQMDNVNDGGMLRVRGTAESNCILELGTWDDSGAGETIQFNYYPTTSQITPTYSVSVPKHSGTLVTADGHGASGTWGISITGNAATATALYTGGPSNTSASDQNARIREAIKAYFNANKASIPRNKTISLYVSTGNGEQATGYFLSGYDSSPYGGFFVCHYDTPRYVGISNGSYSCHELVRNDSRTYSINVSGSAGSVAWANVGSKPATATRWPAWSEVTSKPSTFTPSSHTHTMSNITWTAPQNCACVSTANNQEWSFDMNNQHTGCYWHVWSAKNSASCLQCFNDDRHSWAYKLYGAVWNDYAEFRRAEEVEYGRVVVEDNDKKMKLCDERLVAGAKISSDTFGISIGKSDEYNMPIAVSGRVLAFPYQERDKYKLGAAVCSAPNGTVDIMTREEIMMYPERILGTVSEIPDYDIWYAGGKNEGGGGRRPRTRQRTNLDIRQIIPSGYYAASQLKEVA